MDIILKLSPVLDKNIHQFMKSALVLIENLLTFTNASDRWHDKKDIAEGETRTSGGLAHYPEFHPITSSRYYSLSNLRGENDSKQSDEFQATWTQVIQVFDVPTLAIVNRQHNTVGS